MKAIILAAGYATRLYPLTKDKPKPLLFIGNKPIIEHIISNLEKIENISEIIIVSNERFFRQFQDWRDGFSSRKRINLVSDGTVSQEDKLGAIGDMNFVIEKKQINDDLLVIGGDNLFDADLRNFLAFARDKATSAVVGVYNIKKEREAQKYGVVKLDEEKRVIDFQEKPAFPQSTLVAMCLYYFSKEGLGLIKRYLDTTTNQHDASGFYIDWLRKKEAVYGYVFQGRWYDIGDSGFYKEAKEKFDRIKAG